MERTKVGPGLAAFTGTAGGIGGGAWIQPIQPIGPRVDGLEIPTDTVIVNTQIESDAAGRVGTGNHETWSFASNDFAGPPDYFDFHELDSFDFPGAERHSATLNADAAGTDTVPPPIDLIWLDRLDPGRTSGPSQEVARYADLDEPSDPGASPIEWPGEPTPVSDLPAPQSDSPQLDSPQLDSQGAVQVSTTASDIPLVTIGDIVPLAGGIPIAPLSDSSMPLINLDGFQDDMRFSGIDGSGFAAVILDTGIDLDHPFFGPDDDLDGIADRIVFQYDFANGDADASDQNGHGSNVSSIVASSDSVYGGVAPGADIIHLKVFSDSGSGSFSYLEQALQWVFDNTALYNIASVNMSLGDGGNHGSAQALYGIADEIAALASLDVITVSASGNNFYQVNSVQGVQYPSADPNSLSVGAVYDSSKSGFNYSGGAKAFSTDADAITPFSQRDADLTDIFAPGAPITGAGADGGLVTMHGTSQASPHIAGVAVLAQQLASETLGRRLSVIEFTDLLITTGVIINDGDDENDNVDNTGLDFSRVDVHALGDAILSMVETTVFYTIAATDAAKLEGDTETTPFTFTVTRSGDTTVPSEVSYAVTGNGTDAADAGDFGGTVPSGTLIFAADEVSKTLTIEVSGDLTAEADEGFAVTLSALSPGSAITTATAATTITNDDVPGTVFEVRVSASSDDAEEKASGSVSLSSSDLELIDDRGAQTVGIRFAGIEVPQGAVIVNAYLQFQVDEKDAGAATLEIRGEAVDDALTFSSSAFDITSRSVTSASAAWSPADWNTVGDAGTDQRTSDLTAVVQEVVDRGGWSAANAMAFVISGAGKRVAESFDGKAGAAPLLHIEYQDAPVFEPTETYAITAIDAANPEGDSGTTPFEFTVTRSGDTSAPSEVDYAVTGSGADAADNLDFGGTLPAGTVSFAANETSKVLTVEVSGDLTAEADEGFAVTLSNPPSNSLITTASADAMIANDDTELAISATDAVKPEGDSGTTPFTFTVTRSGDVSGTTDVSYAVTGSGADAAEGSDFGGALPTGTVSFAVNETSKIITVDVSGDGDVEADEGFTVTLSSPTNGAVIAAASDTATIVDDDDTPVVPTEPTVFEVRVSASSDDAEEKASGSVSLSSSDLELIDDRGAQTVGIRFAGIEVPQGAVIVGAYLQFQVDEADAGEATLEIRGEATDDALTFSSSSFDITSRSATSASAAWSPADWNTVGDAGFEQRTSDLTAVVQEVVDRGGWAAANAMAFVISGAGKRVAESFEGKAGAAPLLHIEYQDAPVSEPTTTYAITATDATHPEGNTDTTPFTFTITRSGDTTVSSEVSYAVTGSGADAADAGDFGGALPAETVIFAANEISRIITIDVSGDVDAEADEGFTVTLSAPSAGSAIVTASDTATIVNDDGTPVVPPEPTVFEVRVSASSDDAEEKASGSVSLSSSDLELIDDRGAQTVGIRFAGIEVPQGAVIVNAYLQFQVDEKDAGAATLEIRGEAVDDALTFSSSAFDITSRSVTSASAAWSPADWNTVGDAGTDQQTSNLTAVVQEIVDRIDWSPANAMAFMIGGAGKRVAESFDGKAGAAPLLHIEYDSAEPTDIDFFL